MELGKGGSVLCDSFSTELCGDKCSKLKFVKPPTYIQAFCENPLLKPEIALIHGVEKLDHTDPAAVVQKVDSDLMLELTGNPLECPFGDEIEPTITSIINCWPKEEENHLPIPLQEARTILSTYNMKTDGKKEGDADCPVWVVCSDPRSQTVLLSTHIHDGWCIATQVRCLESMSREQISERLAVVESQHLSISGTPQQELMSEVVCTYDIHGEAGESKQHVSLEVKWASAVTLSVPIYNAEAVVMLKAEIGVKNSPVDAYWKQLNAINFYLEQMVLLQKKLTPSKSVVVMSDVMRDRIVEILRESSYKLGVRYASVQSRDDDEAEQKEIDLDKLVATVANGCRRNRDLMDMLWELLKDCRDSEALAGCLNLVLQTIQAEGYKYNMRHSYENMLLCQMISEASTGDSKLQDVQPDVACKVMVELGWEKVIQDYGYILVKAELMTDDKLQSYFQVQSGSDQLSLLGRLHCVMEVLLLVHKHLNASTTLLRHICAEACRHLLPAQTTFQELLQQQETVLCCRMPVTYVQGHISQNFSKYRLTLTSHHLLHEVKTVFLCSQDKIFPNNIVRYSDETLSSTAWNHDDKTYFCYEMLTNRNKLA